MTSKKELAEEIVHTLPESVSKFILDQGVLHLQALQVAAHALDARITQVATLLFAAAAGSASIVGSTLSWSSGAALAATGFFVFGGTVSLRGVRSDEIHLPGIPPAWWKGAIAEASFSDADARSWAAGLIENAIEKISRENDTRAIHLNASVRCAATGAVIVCVAAGLKLGVSA